MKEIEQGKRSETTKKSESVGERAAVLGAFAKSAQTVYEEKRGSNGK